MVKRRHKRKFPNRRPSNDVNSRSTLNVLNCFLVFVEKIIEINVFAMGVGLEKRWFWTLLLSSISQSISFAVKFDSFLVLKGGKTK